MKKTVQTLFYTREISSSLTYRSVSRRSPAIAVRASQSSVLQISPFEAKELVYPSGGGVSRWPVRKPCDKRDIVGQVC